MDRKEIEAYLADYVEGECDDAVRHEIDEKRRREPDLDRLVRTHERVLSVLRATPPAVAPDGTRGKILAAIRRKEERIAQERKRYHRELMMLAPIGALGAAFLYAVLGAVMGRISTAAYDIAGCLNAALAVPTVSTVVTDGLHMTEAILNHPIQLPFLTASIPAYAIAAGAASIGLLWAVLCSRGVYRAAPLV